LHFDGVLHNENIWLYSLTFILYKDTYSIFQMMMQVHVYLCLLFWYL
jgi:hypothetical protein